MTSLPRSVTAVAISVATLAGCGGSGSDHRSPPTRTSSVAPATGTTISGTGYSFALPDRWDEPPQPVPGTEEADAFATDLSDHDGFADNVNVIRQSATSAPELDELERELPGHLDKEQFTSVDVRDRSPVDGEQAVHISFDHTLGSIKNVGEQYYVFRDGQVFVITFSFSTSVSGAERDKISESILTTWKWDS